MGKSIAIGGYRSSHREHARSRRIGVGAVAGLIIAGLLSAIVLTAVDVVRKATPAQATVVEAPKVYPVRELSREWRGGRSPVRSERMFMRSPTQSPRLDWVREGPKRTRDGYSIDTRREP